MNLFNASDKAIQELTDACDVASFGRNGDDVVDESYRKAGKLDRTQFATTFDLEGSGVMHHIRNILLEGHGPAAAIRPELYKLNVYGECIIIATISSLLTKIKTMRWPVVGPGSFFKPHKDTPRANNMFASLVVVYPTRHEGGALVFRHRNEEFRFDSATAVAQDVPTVAFAAFFSDVEHEVEPVTSGYRVTITYNLYLIKSSASSSIPISLNYELPLKEAFRALLHDDRFLPRGGLIGFGLRYEYPVPTSSGSLEHILEMLKGRDAVIRKVCMELDLRTSIHVLYEFDYNTIISSTVLDVQGYDEYQGDLKPG